MDQKKSISSIKQRLYSSFNRSSLIRGALFFLFLAGIILFMVFLNRPDPQATPSSASKMLFASARVLGVQYDDAEPDYVRSEGRRLGKQELEIEIQSGQYKGETMVLTNYLSALANVDVKAGDKIIVRLAFNDDGTIYPLMFNYNRGAVLGAFILLFALAMAVIGGKKGIMALIGLLFTLVSLWLLLIPLIMRGVNPILATVCITAVTIIVCLFLLDGFTQKALSAIIGCAAGVFTAGAGAALAGHLASLNGFNTGEAEALILNATQGGLTISGLLICGILISSLGAVMDVSMSVASAVHEIHSHNESLTVKALFASGMNVGRDAIGTMANTLILAFTGSSLNMLLITRAYDIPFLQLINTDFIAIEILQGMAGSLGIVLTVPCVSYAAALLMKRAKAPEKAFRRTKTSDIAYRRQKT